MLQRCLNPNDKRYKDYGARGIGVCERWRSFENFYADMGDRPLGKTLERHDNGLGYCPENCVWDTPKMQARNRRSNRLITHNGVTMCLAAWEEYLGLPSRIIAKRLDDLGWSVEKALTQQVELHRRNPDSVIALASRLVVMTD